MDFIQRMVKCPSGHTNALTLPSLLKQERGGTDPRHPLLNPGFDQYSCQTCAETFTADLPLSYFDPTRAQFLLVEPREAIFNWVQAEFQVHDRFMTIVGPYDDGDEDIEERYARRLVFGYQQLREKLILWEAGFDDRMVEIAKLQALIEAPLELRQEERLELILDRIDVDGGRLWYLARRFSPPHSPERIYISFQHYYQLQQNQESHQDFYPELFENTFVNALRYLLLD